MVQKTRNTSALTILLATGSLAALVGCSAQAPDAEPTGDAETGTTATPTAAATDGPDGSELLPVPVDDIRDWAAETVPTGGDDGYVSGFSGWLSQQTSRNLSSFDRTLPAGSYTVTVACTGGSTLSVRMLAADESELAAVDLDCSTAPTQALEVTTPSEGAYTDLALDSAPVNYAVAFQKAA